MIRNKIKIILIFFALLLFSSPVLKNIYWYKMNPWMAIVASFNVTIWSSGFSENAFESIEIGDTENVVKKSLGEPLKVVVSSTGPIWYYTSGPNGEILSNVDGSTHVRGVWFDEEMKVRKKLKYFNFD